jgi:hypothetical protein
MNAKYIPDIAKLAEQCQTPGVHHTRVMHGNGCPATLSQGMGSCNCNPVSRMSNEQEFIEAFDQNQKMRRAAAKAARKGRGGK